MDARPPLPSPGAGDCHNCGQPLPPGVSFCPHCGATVPARTGGGASVLRILGVIFLGVVALVAGALGACFAFVTAFGGASVTAIALAAFGLTLAAVCVAGMIQSIKRL